MCVVYVCTCVIYMCVRVWYVCTCVIYVCTCAIYMCVRVWCMCVRVWYMCVRVWYMCLRVRSICVYVFGICVFLLSSLCFSSLTSIFALCMFDWLANCFVFVYVFVSSLIPKFFMFLSNLLCPLSSRFSGFCFLWHFPMSFHIRISMLIRVIAVINRCHSPLECMYFISR